MTNQNFCRNKIVDDTEILEDSNSENEIPQNIQSGNV